MPTALRLAALVAQLTPGEKAVRLFPAGAFRATDGSGRPTDAPAWVLDADSAAALIARHTARASRRVVDYEHQTLRASANGKPAPAAGWITGLEWRDGDGLYAAIEWTETAAAMIAAGEYRYLSPVFPYQPGTGVVLDIRMAGLTNDPGLDGLTDLAALSAHLEPQETNPMLENLMERLRYLLNLPLTITPAEMGAELDKLKTMVAGAGAASLTAYLEAKDAALTAAVAQASSLQKTQAGTPALQATPDPALYAPVSTLTALQAQVATLTGQIEAGERAALIEAGMSNGRILAPMKAWAESLPVAALKGYLETAKPIAALQGTQSTGTAPIGAGPTPSDADLAVMKALGLTAAQFATGKLSTEE